MPTFDLPLAGYGSIIFVTQQMQQIVEYVRLAKNECAIQVNFHPTFSCWLEHMLQIQGYSDFPLLTLLSYLKTSYYTS